MGSMPLPGITLNYRGCIWPWHEVPASLYTAACDNRVQGDSVRLPPACCSQRSPPCKAHPCVQHNPKPAATPGTAAKAHLLANRFAPPRLAATPGAAARTHLLVQHGQSAITATRIQPNPQRLHPRSWVLALACSVQVLMERICVHRVPREGLSRPTTAATPQTLVSEHLTPPRAEAAARGPPPCTACPHAEPGVCPAALRAACAAASPGRLRICCHGRRTPPGASAGRQRLLRCFMHTQGLLGL